MPKKKMRLLNTPIKNKIKFNKTADESKDGEVRSARGRLKGALLDVLDPQIEDSDADSSEQSPRKLDKSPHEKQKDSDEKDNKKRCWNSPPRQSYVLKLFDRSVDLSQFKEDTPLYPICRAWIANRPKANYSKFGQDDIKCEPEDKEGAIVLPPPEGPPVSRIPELLPEQKACSKDNINLNYKEAPPPTREQLIEEYSSRWAGVRRAWLDQAVRVEERYEATQRVLNELSTNSI